MLDIKLPPGFLNYLSCGFAEEDTLQLAEKSYFPDNSALDLLA
jgi:hypothetical protein